MSDQGLIPGAFGARRAHRDGSGGAWESMAREEQNVNMSSASLILTLILTRLFQFKLPLTFPSFIFCLRFVEKLLLFFSAYN